MQLLVVLLVLRDAPTFGVAPDNIGALISDFLVADMTLERACDLSSAGATLLDLVWTRGRRSMASVPWNIAKLPHTDPHYRRWEFTNAMGQAVEHGAPVIVQWLLSHFPGFPIDEMVVKKAARRGHMGLLELLEDESVRSSRTVRWSGSTMAVAAENHHWDVVWWLDKRLDSAEAKHRSDSILVAAIHQGNSEQLKLLLKRGFTFSPNYRLKLYCSETHWQTCATMLRCLLESGCTGKDGSISDIGLTYAAEFGDLEFAQWVASYAPLANRQQVYDDAVRLAAEYGHLPMVQWLLTQMKEFALSPGLSDVMRAAARRGALSVVQWLHERYGKDPTSNLYENRRDDIYGQINLTPSAAMDIAAANNHLEVLQYLHSVSLLLREKDKAVMLDMESLSPRYPVCTTIAMDMASAAGNLEVVRWLHENRLEGCTTSAMDYAASNGHLAVVKWLHANRTEGCTTAAFDRAISNWHLDVAQWLYSNCPEACTISSFDSVAAARSHRTGCIFLGYCACLMAKLTESFVDEQLRTLEWLKQHFQAGFTSAAMDGAASAGNLKVLDWLLKNTTVDCTAEAMDIPARDGRLDVIKWLHQHTSAGCTTKAMDLAARVGNLDVVRWLHENRSEGCTSKAMDDAASYGHLKMVKWLHKNRPESCAATALTAAASYSRLDERRRQLDVVRYLLSTDAGVCVDRAMIGAVQEGHFEIVLLLHAQHPTLNGDEVRRMKRTRLICVGGSELVAADNRLDGWLEEHYPSPA